MDVKKLPTFLRQFLRRIFSRQDAKNFATEGIEGDEEAGTMSGGDYILTGGFWPAISYCMVDLPDLATFCSFWLVGSGAPQGDFNDNGSCDLADYNYLASYWLRLCPGSWPWW